MQFFLRRRTILSACLIALGLAVVAPAAAAAKPEPEKKRGFRLFARAGGSLRVNQVQCGIISDGQICVDSLGSSTIPGSVWPKGTNNQYTFNSGIQIAGIIGDEMPAWAGDTTGALFFEGSGGLLAGEQIEPIYNASDPEDFNNWPEFARVPSGDDLGAPIYDPLLQGQISASQGDVYFISWDGNPSSLNGRLHPLGVAVETRGLAWNFPPGNQDIIYFVYTLYNISSVEADDYVGVRQPLKDRLLEVAADFQARNEAAFGVDIPTGGYTIQDAFMAFAADQDVADATADLSSFNNLFDLAVTYHAQFEPLPGNVFDPAIHAPPFLPGPGFVGTKYLRSPILEDGTEAGTVLAGLTTNRGTFPDAGSLTQSYRYLSGNLNPAAGDPQCNTGNPDVTHLCFINEQASDTRTFQSSGPLTLPPGGQATIVVAYIFAAPVSTGACSSIPCPGPMVPQPLLVLNATESDPGVAPIDSAMGYRGFFPGTGDDVVQDSVRTVPNSLLDKAKVAQQIFDSKFLLPFAPTAPDFYLVPGDGQVTVLWRPSASEASGDPFFNIANDPTSLQYDPNYREQDVEGYRIYRGRTDTPNQLELVAQFDYAGTVIHDYAGIINPTPDCAPELAIVADPTACPFTIPGPGLPFTDSVDFELSGPIVQVADFRFRGTGQRVALADGTALVLRADTLVTGGGTGFPELSNTGVPFAFTDDGSGLVLAPRNNVRYFYTVTAFDVNSLASGPSSLESQRIARAVVPVARAANVQAAQLSSGLFGDDGTELDPDQEWSIDAATGRFSGTPPPTDGVEGTFAPLVPILLPAVSLTATIDSVKARVEEDPLCAGQANALNACYIFYVTFDRDGALTPFTVPVALPVWVSFGAGDVTTRTAGLGALAVLPDPTTAARYGIPQGAGASNAAVGISSRQYIEWSSFEGQAARRDLFTHGAGVSPGGSRWFSGDDETEPHPGASIRVGRLDGVDTVWAPIHHTDIDPLTPGTQEGDNSPTIQWFGYGSAGLSRQADVQITWGENGAVESVRDLTHHVPVLFKPDLQASYGFVQDANGDGVINWPDFSFIPGMAEFWIFQGQPEGPASAADAVPLVETATVSAVSTGYAVDAGPTGQGFGLYINGERYIFELTGGALPAAGTRWTLRTYTGQVRAASNAASTTPGDYSFIARVRSPSVPGLQVQFTVAQPTLIANAQDSDLSRVHTVPDPYYVTSEFETTTTDKVIRFVNLPTRALIRIYSSSGVLVRVLEHNSTVRGERDEDISVLGGQETWDVRNRNNQVVASGVYFYHIEAGDARKVGRFTVVNFAQ